MHAEEVALHPPGHARGPPDQALPVRGAADADDHPLAGLPGVGDAMVGQVGLERLLDPVGDPQQGQLPQGAEVPRPEVVGEGGIDSLGRVDVAVGHAPAQRLGRHVDQLDLVGGADDGVGHGLALATPVIRSTTSLSDSRCWTLTVEIDVDPRVEQLLDVLPALLVRDARRVGVGELVDQRDGGPSGEDGVEIHLLERRAAVLHLRAGHDREVAELGRGRGPAVRLDVADDHVGASGPAAPPLGQHGVRLPDAGRGTEVHPQSATSHRCQCAPAALRDAPCRGPRRAVTASVGDARGRAHREVDEHGQAPSRRVVEDDAAVDGFDEAARHGETEADPAVAVMVTEALEGLEDALPVDAVDPRPAVDDAEVHPMADDAPPRPAPDVVRGDQASELTMMCASARSSRAGSVSTAGRESGTSISTCSGRWSMRGQRGRDHIFEEDRTDVRA